MKRILSFKFLDDQYCLEEEGTIVFSIPAKTLVFNSKLFYQGVYKDKDELIELEKKLDNDLYKKGDYIFNWLTEIINSVNESMQKENVDYDIKNERKKIPKIHFSSLNSEGEVILDDDKIDYLEDYCGDADFSIILEDDSMEPSLNQNSTLYVRKDEVKHDEIGLFSVNGQVLCRRLKIQGRGSKLVADNEKYEPIKINKKKSGFIVIGKVLMNV